MVRTCHCSCFPIGRAIPLPHERQRQASHLASADLARSRVMLFRFRLHAFGGTAAEWSRELCRLNFASKQWRSALSRPLEARAASSAPVLCHTWQLSRGGGL